MRAELRRWLADRLTWWAYRLDAERFSEQAEGLVALHDENECDGRCICDMPWSCPALTSTHQSHSGREAESGEDRTEPRA